MTTWRERQRRAGRCVRCGKHKAAQLRQHCRRCLASKAAKVAAYRARHGRPDRAWVKWRSGDWFLTKLPSGLWSGPWQVVTQTKRTLVFWRPDYDSAPDAAGRSFSKAVFIDGLVARTIVRCNQCGVVAGAIRYPRIGGANG